MLSPLADETRRAAFLTIGATVVLFLLAWEFVPYIFPHAESRARRNELPDAMPKAGRTVRFAAADIWLRFDTVWYARIARQGYVREQDTVFYPLYPALIRLGQDAGLDPVVAALAVSRVGVFFALWGFMAWLRGRVPIDAARRAVWLCLLWPAGFMLFAGYPDSLLLACAVWAFHFASSGRWAQAIVPAVIAPVTKATGALLIPALIVLAWRKRRLRHAAPAIALSALAALVHPLWLRAHGFPSLNATYAKHWVTTPAAPWRTVSKAFAALGDANPEPLVNLLALCAALWLAWRAAPQPEYRVWTAALVAVFITKNTQPVMQSTMRYSLLVFPAFAGLATLLDRPWKQIAVYAALALFNLLLFALFVNWYLVV
jgi:hypothetical protein